MSSRKRIAGGEFLVTTPLPSDVFTPEQFSNEHKMIHKAALEFVQKEIQANIDRVEHKDDAFILPLFKKAGDLGLNGTDIPEIYGGEEMGLISTCLVSEALGYGASFSVSHSAHTGIGTLPIVFFGTHEQKTTYLPKLASGEWVGAYCLTEPNAGSDALNAQTTAHVSSDGTHYLLNGEKIYITNGSWADVYIVYAKVDGEHFTGFIVQRDFPGLSIGPEEKKMGINGSSTTSVILKDCRVPKENVLFEVGLGHKIAFNILNIGRFKLGAGVTGTAKLAIAEAAKYALSRHQFGQPIASFGAIQEKLAGMAVRTLMTESLVYRLAGAIEDRLEAVEEDSGSPGAQNAKAIEEYAVECSIAKVFGSECLDYCVDEYVQIMGGNGFIAEYPAERMYRDSRINRIFEGTNEINRLLIPGTLLKRAAQNRLPLLQAMQQAASGTPGEDTSTATELQGALPQEQHMLAQMKQVTLLAAAQAFGKHQTKLAKEQEVMLILADMIMDIYAAESGLLRAIQLFDRKGEAKARFHVSAVQIYLSETLPKFAARARTIFAYVGTGDSSRGPLDQIHQAAMAPVFDTISLKRELAQKVLKGKRYPF